MIIVMQPDAAEAEINAVEAKIRSHGLEVHISRGTERTLIGAIGDERKLDPEMFDPLPGVERSLHILKPYKLVAREGHKASTVVDERGARIGGNDVQVIAGPCSVETVPITRPPRSLTTCSFRTTELRSVAWDSHRIPSATGDTGWYSDRSYSPTRKLVTSQLARCSASNWMKLCSAPSSVGPANADRTTVRNESTTTIPGSMRSTSAVIRR